jgi:hypothetical protein
MIFGDCTMSTPFSLTPREATPRCGHFRRGGQPSGRNVSPRPKKKFKFALRHNGEKAYMNRIFSSDPKTLRTMGANLENMREVFKKTTKSILDDVHGDDVRFFLKKFKITHFSA